MLFQQVGGLQGIDRHNRDLGSRRLSVHVFKVEVGVLINVLTHP